MSTDLSYPHIEKSNGKPARLKRFARIRVAQIVMDYLAHAWSPDEICRQYPHLNPAEVHAAMAYYYDHQKEIDDEIHAEIEQVKIDRANAKPAPFFLRMEQKGLL